MRGLTSNSLHESNSNVGFTNGLGRTNGLINGLGRTNGLTNGMVNGLTHNKIPARKLHRRNHARTSILSIIIIGIISAMFFVMVSVPSSNSVIEIDGDFSDWEEIPRHRFGDIECSFVLDKNDFFIYTDTDEDFWLYISNGDMRGYRIGNKFVDYKVFIDHTCKLFGYSANDNLHDRNSWTLFHTYTPKYGEDDARKEMNIRAYALGYNKDLEFFIQTKDGYCRDIVSMNGDTSKLILNSSYGASRTDLDSIITIDGEFSDWEGIFRHDDIMGDVKNRGADISIVKNYESDHNSYFYVRAVGEMFTTEMETISISSAQGSSSTSTHKTTGGRERPTPTNNRNPIEIEYTPRLSKDVMEIEINGLLYTIDASEGNIINASKEISAFKNDREIEIQVVGINLVRGFTIRIGTYNGETDIYSYGVMPISWMATTLADTTKSGGDLMNYALSTTPTIDGWVQESEWSDADNYTVDLELDMKIYIKHDTWYTYIAVDTVDDYEINQGDSCSVMFDGNLSGGLDPEIDDFRLISHEGNATDKHTGSGGAWISEPSADATARYSNASGKIQYEFKINNSYVIDVQNDGDIFGFGVELHQNGTQENWIYYPDACLLDAQSATFEDTPNDWDYSTWKTTEIPEFEEIVLPVMFISMLIITIRRKKSNAKDG